MAKSQIQTGKIATYNLGEKGVVITKSPVHGEDGELALAQNSVPNPEGGLSGLRKRIGFRALNASAAAGGILAFISCNLEDPGVIAVNPAAFGKWLYSANGGATWVYLDVQQSVALASIPINYDGFDRLAFLHLTEDTDKTGLVAVDQVSGVNAWSASAVPAAGDDPGRVPYTIQHTLDLGDGYLYYVSADGLKIRRWGKGADAELVAMPAEVVGIVDWDTDGTDIWVLTTYNFNYPTEPYRQQVYKIDVSAGTAAKVGTVLTLTGATWDGATAWTQHYHSLVVINLNGTTPTVVVGGYEWVSDSYTSEHTQQAHVAKLAGSASDATEPTEILTKYDTKEVPTGHAFADLTAQALLSTPAYYGDTNPSQKIVQFGAGDTITVGDITYTAVEKANLTTPNTFFRGGVWDTGTISVLTRPSGGNPGGINIPITVQVASYTYKDGLTALLWAISGYGAEYGGGTGTVANPLVYASSAGATVLRVTARASGSAGNGIAVSESSSIASWSASTLAGGVYTATAKANKVKVTDLINDATKGIVYVAVSSDGGHSEIKKIVYPIVGGAWTASWSDVRAQLYPFGYVSVWADNDVLLYLETPLAVSLQLSKGVKVGTAVFFLIGTGLATSADINLIALASGALQRIALP
jgi:hypothetical protein